MLQSDRNRVFHEFRKGVCRNLVCTGSYPPSNLSTSSSVQRPYNPTLTRCVLPALTLLFGANGQICSREELTSRP
jgi:hypothetical protein